MSLVFGIVLLVIALGLLSGGVVLYDRSPKEDSATKQHAAKYGGISMIVLGALLALGAAYQVYSNV